MQKLVQMNAINNLWSRQLDNCGHSTTTNMILFSMFKQVFKNVQMYWNLWDTYNNFFSDI